MRGKEEELPELLRWTNGAGAAGSQPSPSSPLTHRHPPPTANRHSHYFQPGQRRAVRVPEDAGVLRDALAELPHPAWGRGGLREWRVMR